jgi:methylated-DNA-[protein]-cysteine S-methyltransferase
MGTTHTVIETRLGRLTLVAEDGALSGVYFPGHWTRPDPAAFGERARDGFAEAERQIGEYLDGARTSFELPTSARGEAFQQRVWERLARIPYGETVTYGEIARELGDPALARRVGGAVGRNPLSIVVPCHRVVGRDGALTGYAGGLERKRLLLELEGWPGVAPAPAARRSRSSEAQPSRAADAAAGMRRADRLAATATHAPTRNALR